MFWQTGTNAPAEPSAAAELSDAEFAEFLGTSPHAVPPQPLGAPEARWVSPAAATGTGIDAASIDFQAQYDAAGIPDTDEVEQLEGFLSRLDDSLPQTSKLAAARAFLGAIGKSREHVLEDAARKIECVRSLQAAKHEETQLGCANEQRQIDALQAEIEQHRQRMEGLTRELEGVRQACLEEESRLQAARVFFGNALSLSEGEPPAG